MIIWAYLLFIIPLVLFVVAFLYETLLSFLRLRNPKSGREGYVHATWEVTHTLLIFAVVVMLMMFTKSIDGLAAAIFTTTMLAAVALSIRSCCYIYIFYVRKTNKQGLVDWLFAFSHVAAALFLVLTVIKALFYLYQNNPQANTQFIPAFIPGLVFVLLICIMPIVCLYLAPKK